MMQTLKTIEWFKKEIAPILQNEYVLTYRYYENGDFGSLNQVIFESTEKGGGIDFWGLGWLGLDIYDYKKDKQLLNVLLEPHQEREKEKAFKDFQNFLK